MTASTMVVVVVVVVFFFLITTATFDGFPSGKLKRTHLHFFFQDVVSGANPTAIRVASVKPNTPVTTYGSLLAVDDRLTETAEISSTLVGRAQGIFAFTSQEELSLLMVFNLLFVSGKYNGSTLTMVGRNPVLEDVREMPIVGGTGTFRMARGYAQARTVVFNRTSNDATVEYNVYVLHHY